MSFLWHRPALLLALFAIVQLCPLSSFAIAQQSASQTKQTQGSKSSSPKQPPATKAPSESEQLQQAIDSAGNDRVALVHNLEEFLDKYPEASKRPQIYRALVEACLQLQDSRRAADYAERIVALAPEDISITVLAIQLLERSGDQAALRRAVSYSSRVLDYIGRGSAEDKSPKISKEEWESEQKRDKMNILALRGRLSFKLHDNAAAEKDFRAAMALSPSAAAGEKLGEIAELNKDFPGAIREYARAFALADASGGGAIRKEIRQKLGNVWRLAHGSDQGLGDYLLHAYDEVSASSDVPKPKRNAAAKAPYEFTLRNARDGSSYSLAAQFQGIADIVFLAADCDEDESLVPPYLEEEKPRTTVVFADGLDRLLAVNSFPTVVVLDRTGKIAYRAEGFDPDDVETELSSAIRHALTAKKESAEKFPQGAKSAP